MADPVGGFSLHVTSTKFDASDDGLTSEVNVEGAATGYGTVAGTLTFSASEAGATSGPLRWVGQGFLDDGTTVVGTGEGTWTQQEGKHRWDIATPIEISNGDKIRVEGVLDLGGRTYAGRIFEA